MTESIDSLPLPPVGLDPKLRTYLLLLRKRLLTDEWITFTSLDTSPSVAGGTNFYVANGGATSINTFDDATDGQIINLLFTNANTTLIDASQGGGDNLRLNGGADRTTAQRDTITLIYHEVNDAFYQRARSDNSP